MHEISIAQSIPGIKLDYSRRNGAGKVFKIHLQIAKIRDVNDEGIPLCFDWISKGALAAGEGQLTSRSYLFIATFKPDLKWGSNKILFIPLPRKPPASIMNLQNDSPR